MDKFNYSLQFSFIYDDPIVVLCLFLAYDIIDDHMQVSCCSQIYKNEAENNSHPSNNQKIEVCNSSPESLEKEEKRLLLYTLFSLKGLLCTSSIEGMS